MAAVRVLEFEDDPFVDHDGDQRSKTVGVCREYTVTEGGVESLRRFGRESTATWSDWLQYFFWISPKQVLSDLFLPIG